MESHNVPLLLIVFTVLGGLVMSLDPSRDKRMLSSYDRSFTDFVLGKRRLPFYQQRYLDFVIGNNRIIPSRSSSYDYGAGKRGSGIDKLDYFQNSYKPSFNDFATFILGKRTLDHYSQHFNTKKTYDGNYQDYLSFVLGKRGLDSDYDKRIPIEDRRKKSLIPYNYEKFILGYRKRSPEFTDDFEKRSNVDSTNYSQSDVRRNRDYDQLMVDRGGVKRANYNYNYDVLGGKKVHPDSLNLLRD